MPLGESRCAGHEIPMQVDGNKKKRKHADSEDRRNDAGDRTHNGGDDDVHDGTGKTEVLTGVFGLA